MRLTTACLKSGTSDICRHISDTLQRHLSDICLQTSDEQCARQCAQTRSEDHHSAAKANQAAKKNGPEIIDFRPVL
jgi:hypothetical protein